jgi:hypothetical protein
MSIITLKKFKSIRKTFGTVYGMCSMLESGGLTEHQVERAVDAIVADLGLGKLERMKSKDTYDICDGFLVGCQEYNLTHSSGGYAT